MERSFKETIHHYQDVRDALFEFVEEQYPGVQAREITLRDAQTADQWPFEWQKSTRTASWQWTKMYSAYRSNSGIKRFDLALHQGGRLLALCYGVPSRNKLTLKLHALERAPGGNPLSGRVVSMIFFAASAYARLLGARELWLCNPVSDAHVRLYQKSGFEPIASRPGMPVKHLVRRIIE